MKDCIRSWRNRIAAVIASVCLSACAMKEAVLSASRAIHSFGKLYIADEIKAGVIIWKHPLKVFECEFGHLAFVHFGCSL